LAYMQMIRLLILLSLSAQLFVSCSSDPAPDTIFIGGTVLTVDKKNSVVEAIAIKDGVIVQVGTTSAIKSTANSSTDIIELDGQTLVPGFIAAHEHPTLTAVFADTIDLSAFTFNSPDDMWLHLKEQVALAGKGDWIYGMGLDPVLMPELVLPSKNFLDQIAPDNPLVIVSQTMHSFWANSRAFAEVAIDNQTVDPGNGSYYGRDQDGHLNGFISESEAATPFLQELKSPLGVVRRYEQTLQNLVESGFTSVASVGFNIPPIMARYAASDFFEPKIRQFIYLTNNELEYLPKSPIQENNFYKIIGLKLWHDGSPYTGTMALDEPYLFNSLTAMMGISEGHKGTSRLDQQEFEQQIIKFSQAGWQLAVHSQGDHSNASAAQTFSQLLGENNKQQRHRFEHCLLIKEATLQAFQKQGLTPSFHINHILYYGDALADNIIGERRAQRVLPVKTAFDLELHPTLHADSPMFPADPISLMKTAVIRQTKSGKTLGIKQAISPQQALRTMTINGAWQLHMDNEIGSIEVGKSADLVILNDNLYQLAPHQWDTIKVNEVWLAGKRQHRNRTNTFGH
jgi:predicted amidohydrolase YtcJ